MKRNRFAILLLPVVAASAAGCRALTQTRSPTQVQVVASSTVALPPTHAPEATPAEAIATTTQVTIAPSAGPVATSRGPNLEATEPASVRLNAGTLQLVEFFRFT